VTFEIRSMRVELDGVELVRDFSLTLIPGRVHAVIGASGGGKTIAALAVLGLEPEGAVVTNRPVDSRAGFSMVLQEPLSALNPVIRVGAQIRETLKVHGQPLSRASELMKEVGLSDERLHAFPHELSGGQRQRVAIACALAANPRVLIADEPTTALDVSTRNKVLELLRDLAKNRNLAVWLISHDLDAVRAYADDITSLTPQHERVVSARPTHTRNTSALLRAEQVNVHYGAFHAVKNVSLTVARGERLGIIGESGSGKSSLARALLGLQDASGLITFDGQPMHNAPKALRKRFQPVFQDVGAALDPRLTIAESLAEPFKIHALKVGDLDALMKRVQLSPELLDRLPRELSTGQRQRVNLARALALEPELLLLDEPVSALDVRVADEIIALLQQLTGPSLLVITHDLDVVERLCARICVMRLGEIVESGPVEEVLKNPRHAYTQQLAAAHAHVLAQPPSP
jgi:ABC-type glutathione transport system ATPase component